MSSSGEVEMKQVGRVREKERQNLPIKKRKKNRNARGMERGR